MPVGEVKSLDQSTECRVIVRDSIDKEHVLSSEVEIKTFTLPGNEFGTLG